MKLTFFLLTTAFLSVSAEGLSQNISFNGNSVPLTKIFSEVEKQTGYVVTYTQGTLKGTFPVSVSMKNSSLDNFLQKVLEGQPIKYTIDAKTILLSRRLLAETEPNPKLGSSDALDVFNDTLIEASGRVMNEAGEPLAGASIQVKGTSKGTATNSNGNFIIKVNAGQVLVISSVGFAPKQITINNETIVNIELKTITTEIDSVVIGASSGYQTIQKERATGSYNVVSAKELSETPTINIIERIEGRVPGVRVGIRNNTIQVRTSNNYSANSAPLIVIDGFPQIARGDNQSLTQVQSNQSANNALFSYINSDDIEQITFLKDASATSIWGARGANGVIVIETKKGRVGEPSVNFTTTVGLSKAANLQKLKWMNAAEYIDLEQELVNNNYLADPANATGTAALYTSNNSEATEWMFKVKRGTATVAERDAALLAIGKRNNQQQINDYLLQNALNQQYNLSVSGGSPKSTYYISGNYTRDRPVFRSNEASSASFSANITSDLFKKRVKLRSGFNYQSARSKSNLSAIDALATSNTALRPYDLLKDETGNTIKRDIYMRPETAEELVKNGYLPFSFNAVDELNYSNTTSKEVTFRLNTGLNIKVTDWINLDLSGMIQQFEQNQNTIEELNSFSTRMLVNEGTSLSPSNKLIYGVPFGGTYTLSDRSAYDYSLRGQVNVNKRFHQNHLLVALAGAEVRETYEKGYGSKRYGYDPDLNTSVAVNPSVPYTTMYGWTSTLSDPLTGLSERKNRYLSYYSNLSYSYANKYTVTGSMRFDDYTLLGLDRRNRAVPLWSAGLRWNAEKEDFLNHISFLDNLGIRLTLGTGGSVPLSGSNVTVIAVSGTDFRTGQPQAYVQTPANQDLGWETTKTLNGGIDVGFFKNRLSGGIDIYQKWSKGILVFMPFNATYGWSNLYSNSATLSSHGADVYINGKIISNNNFEWSSTLNLGFGTNKVTDTRFKNNSSTLVSSPSPVEGMPTGRLFVYRWAGLSNTGQSQIFDRNNKIINSSTNLNSAEFSKDDLKYAGVTVAPYFGGYFNSFKYKSFELAVQISYYLGHVFLRQSIDNYPFYQGYPGVLSKHKDLAFRWRNPGDEASTNVPGLTSINFNSINRYKYSDALVEKADNIRLQQVALSYAVPTKKLLKNTFKSLTVSGSVRNLGLIWAANKQGIDPEYLNTNSFSNLPPATSFIVSLQASF